MVPRPSALAFFALESMNAKYPHFLITNAGVFGASRHPKAETGNNPQFIVAEVQIEWGTGRASSHDPASFCVTAKSRALS